MGKIATLVHHCSKCNNYFNSEVGICPKCKFGLEAVAVINCYELQQLMAKLQTPQGIVNLLESFRSWVEQ